MNMFKDCVNVGQDIEDIIINYVEQLEREEMIKNHKITFEDTLDEIRDMRNNDIYDFLLEGLNFEMNYNNDNNDIYEYIVFFGDNDYFLNLINRLEDYTIREFLNNVLMGYRTFYNYDNIYDYLDEMDKIDIGNVDRNISWWDTIEQQKIFIENLLDIRGITEGEKESFLEYCSFLNVI